MKLRGATEADFFQKNNNEDRGWTFNYDGTLSEFKKPKIQKELEEKVAYEVDFQAIQYRKLQQ